MNLIQPYHLDDADRAKRLRELTDTEHPTALEGELALARLLQEEAVNAGNTNTAIALLGVIGRLSQASEVAKFRRGELLNRMAVLSIASKIVEILSANVAGRFDGWEEVIDGVKQKVLTVVYETRNPDPNDLGSGKVPE